MDVSTYLLWYDEYYEYINDNRERHIPGRRKAASTCTTVRRKSGHIPGRRKAASTCTAVRRKSGHIPGRRKAGHTCVNDIGGITGYSGKMEV